MKGRAAIFAAGIWLSLAASATAQLTVLHHFTQATADAAYPNGSLTFAGTNLVGLAPGGGGNDLGALFQLGTNGAGYAVLHHANETATDGSVPWGSLTPGGAAFFGTTAFGGNSRDGTVFRINADGTGFSLLHHFTAVEATNAWPGDGGGPVGDLLLSGPTLYGMTRFGGSNNLGTIFALGTNGAGFRLLHHFAGSGTTAEGALPCGALTQLGASLYGLTPFGGTNNHGVLFMLGTNGNNYAALHNFAGAPDDGATPNGSLAASGSTFYGLTTFGGSNGLGTIFKINADGTGYTNLHHFTGATNDGAFPYGSLAIVGSTLYGLTSAGGASNAGTIFQIKTDGAGGTNLYSFTSGADGASPCGSPTLTNGALFAMTSAGGANNLGVVCALTLPINFAALDSVGDSIPDWWRAQYFPGADPTGRTTNSQSCATCDAAGTGQNNFFKYITGLNPTNPASAFTLKITPGLSNRQNLLYGPVASGRIYAVEFTTNLTGMAMTSLTSLSEPQTNGSQVTVTDPNAVPPARFYRLRISLP